jgi:hypothetical protein
VLNIKKGEVAQESSEEKVIVKRTRNSENISCRKVRGKQEV